MSTPANPVNPRAKGQAKDQRTAWEKALDSLDKSRPVKFGQHYEKDADNNEIGDPAVWLAREADPQYANTALWTKAYIANAARDLRVFNFHERDMLGYLKTTQHCYHLVEATETNITSLARLTGGLTANLPPFAMRTTDKGTSIKQWMDWPVKVGKVPHDHVFRLAGHYLRFARGALVALDELHARRVTHLDLNTSNWTLEATFVQLTDGAQRLRLCPGWSDVSIIDVGYSIHPDKMPPVQLPLDTTFMSKRFKDAYQNSYADGQDAFNKLTAQERRNNGWTDYKDVLYVRDFWATHAPTALSAYKTIDWREDYLRLGQVLKSMRGGRQKKDRRTDEWIPGVESKVWCSVGAVNKFIGESAIEGNATGMPGLAEELIAWGNTATLYDSNPNEKIRLEHSKAMREEIHAALLQRLDEVIALLTPEDDAEYAFLMREDIDPGYRDQLKAEAEQKKRVDQAKREAEEKKAERAAHRRALWSARAEKAVRGTILAASLAGVVGTGAYSYENWLKPTLIRRQQEHDEANRAAKVQQEAAVQRVKSAQLAVQQAVLGSAPWRGVIEQLAALCQQSQPDRVGSADAAPTVNIATDCTAAFAVIQQDYLHASPQSQKDAWWREGRFDTQPSADMRNWLLATRTLAEKGLWVAQVNQAMVSTVAAVRPTREDHQALSSEEKLKQLTLRRKDQLAGAGTLLTLVAPQQLSSSAFNVTVPLEVARLLRAEAAELLMDMRRKAENEIGIGVSKQILPNEQVLAIVHAVTDTPSQAMQVKLAYSLICWTDKPDDAQATAYFAKAEATQNGNDPAIADRAKRMRRAHENGEPLCKK